MLHPKQGMERRRRKYDPRPKKIHRSEGSYWVPNPGVTEHFLDQRLKELGKQQTMFENEFKRDQKEIQRELANIRTKDQRGNYRTLPRRVSSKAGYGIQRRSSMADTIEKYRSKRTDQEYLNNMLRQKRDSVVNCFEPSNTQDPTGKWQGSQTSLNRNENMSYPVYKPVAPSSSQLPPGRTILDEMRNALEVAEHAYAEDIACGRRRWNDHAARDYIYDIGRAGYERVKDNKYIIRDLRRPARQSSYSNKTPVHRNIKRPQRILLDEETSVVQVNFRKKNPIYINDQSYPLSPVQENRSRISEPECKKTTEWKREDSVPKNEASLAATLSSTSLGDEEKEQAIKKNDGLNKTNSNLTFPTPESQQKDAVKSAVLLKQKTYAGSPSPIGIFHERALTSADLLKHRRRNANSKTSDNPSGNMAEEFKKVVQVSDHEQPCPVTKDQSEFDTEIASESNENDPNAPKKEIDEYDLEDDYSTNSESDLGSMDRSNSEHIWNDVRRCRYLRGYDPPDMVLPRGEINLFVFGRDENDILEFKRTKERKIHSDLEGTMSSHHDDD